MPLYLGEAKLSAKWRRSKKHLKRLNTTNPNQTKHRNHSKALRVENLRIRRSIYPQKFGLPKTYGKRKWKEPKPLIDILQEKDWITIVAQLAGFNKETLKINVTDQKLTLSAKAKDRRYYKSLNLPKVVIPNIVHTTYKNGVLEIKLKKATEEKTIDKISGLENAT